MTLRLLLRSSCALALMALLVPAWGLGFGPAPQAAVLGRPLDLSVSLRLDPGETLAVACVSAQVTSGDLPVPADRVVWSLTPVGPLLAILRVRTTEAITEPVLGVVVSAGCPPRVSRRYTLLADPPGHRVPSPPVVFADRATASPDDMPTSAVALAQPAPATPSGRPRAVEAAGAQVAPARTAAAPAAAEPARAPRLELTPPPAVAAPATRAVAAPAARAVAAPSAPGPLPAAPAEPAVDTVAEVDAAREAVIAAQEQAAAAHARADALEQGLQGLRVELRQQREQSDALRAALERAQASSELAWWALAGMALLMLLVLWAWVRSRSGAAVGRVAWWRARSDAAPGDGRDDVPMEPAFAEPMPQGTAVVSAAQGIEARPDLLAGAPVRRAGGPSEGPGGGMGLQEDPEPLAERTRLIPPSTAQGSAPLQAVSMEELLELEQHVEFLVVLGQEQAAAVQLMDHLRRTGGAYPLPYLKLMEIHRRMGDEQAYEAMREQFNQRFNAVAPAFGAQIQASRGLEDYPAALGQIERVWGRPVDAMALLENLLFRNRGGEFFDLAALGDVVFLYTLARDLERHSGPGTTSVDVLLMLEDGPPAPSAQQPRATQTIEWPSLDLPSLDLPPSESPAGGAAQAASSRIVKSARL